ncbi:hypothetical protein TNCV_2677981 [Trichonephila clavipes]|nr:hypothetical protein TNCV_2677981 [Trichonephila clavipes]
MVENREGSLGYPGFVTPVFTKDSKPLGKRKRSLGHFGIVTPTVFAKCACVCGSLVVKVTEWWAECYEFEPSTAEDPLFRETMHVKSVENQTYCHWCRVEARRGGASSEVVLVT